MEKGSGWEDFLDPGSFLFYLFLPITLPLYILFVLFGGF